MLIRTMATASPTRFIWSNVPDAGHGGFRCGRNRPMAIRELSRFPGVLVTCLMLCWLTGCYSYAELLRVRESNSLPLKGTRLTAALVAVAEVAREFGLEPAPDFSSYQKAWAEGPNPQYLLALYGRGESKETRWSNIFLAVSTDNMTGTLLVLLRDWNSHDSTEFTRPLKQRLVESLSAAVDSSQITVERLHDRPWLVAP